MFETDIVEEIKTNNEFENAILKENENGKTVGMVSVLTDISKQKELDSIKSEFTSKMTHELRSPIAALKQTIAMILEQTAGTINDIQKKILTIAFKNIERLNRLVNDLLDLSKLEAGKMVLPPETNKLDELIEETITTFLTWANNKNILLSFDVDKSIPTLSFDKDKIIQVLSNLINNALKFTESNGTIIINASLDESRDFVKIFIEDSGTGIEKKDFGKIFDKFVQVGKKRTEEIKGTGLGLPITKEIVELHQGKIWVESPVDEGRGTRFVFTLPVKLKVEKRT